MNVEVRKLISSIEKGTIPTGYKKTKLGIIPDEWEISTLGEVSTFKNGKAHEQNVSEDGRFIIVNSKFISTEGNEFKRSNTEICPLKKGDITLVMSDVPNGKALAKCFFIDRDNVYTLNQRICSITVNRKKMDEIFSFYYLNRNNYFLRFDNGVGQTNLRKDEVLNCPVIKPPIQEQQKIASILSTWDKAIELKEKLIEQKKEQKKGLMQKLLTGEVRLPGYDEEWFRIKIDRLISEISEKSTINNQYEVLSVTKNGIVSQNEHFKKQVASENNVGYKVINKNNLVFSTMNLWMGSLDVLTEYEIGIVSPAYKVFEFNLENIIPSFAKFYMLSEQMIWLYNVNSEQGASIVRRNLDLKALLNTSVKVPSIQEQQAISKVLITINKEIKLLENELELLKHQKQGLMQQLLTGKIRVKV